MRTIPTLQEIQSLYPNTEAILFDMDGTLFNSEPIHGQAIKRIVDIKAKDALSVEEINEEFTGYLDHMVYSSLKERTLIPDYMTWSDFLATKNKYMLELIADLDQEAFPEDSQQLLDEIKSSPVKMGLVTSSERLITNAMLERFNIQDHFDLTTTRDDVEKFKPNPLPYQQSMQHLNVAQEKAIIFEDSTAGLEAAKASGANVVEAAWFH